MRIVINSEFITGQVQVDFGNGFETFEPADYANGIHIPESVTDLSTVKVKANSNTFKSLDVLYNAFKFSAKEDANLVEKDLGEITENGPISFALEEGEDGASNVTGTVNVQPALQEKTVTYDARGAQSPVTADAGFYGLSSVTVNVDVPEPDIAEVEAQTFDANGTYSINVPEGKDGQGDVEVTVAVPLEENKTKEVEGCGEIVVNPSEGFTAMEKATINVTPKLQDRTIVVGKSDDNVTEFEADAGYDGLGKVKVDVVDEDFIENPNVIALSDTVTANGDYVKLPTDLPEGVDGYNSVAIHVAVPLETNKNVEVGYDEEKEITPSEGFTALEKVTVTGPAAPKIFVDRHAPITSNGTKEFSVPEGYDGLAGFSVDVNVVPTVNETIDVSTYEGPVEINTDEYTGTITLENIPVAETVNEDEVIEISMANPESDPRVHVTEDGFYEIAPTDGFSAMRKIKVKVIDDRPILAPSEFIIADDALNLNPSDFVVQDTN